MMIALKQVVFFTLLTASQCIDRPIVQTPLGAVTGYSKTSHNGRKFSAFEGIPFAKPPIGSLRFEPPQPIEPWTGVWNATTTTTCAQKTPLMGNLAAGAENCLHLNVYVPREVPNPADNLDVIVHIHGGAYIAGSGHFYCDPVFVMDDDVVFISINYRLGILGFLSTEDDVVSGNNGLKDQAMALKWVRDNIGSFGGNPNSVTLSGISAGGGSVHFHYFSEWSKGLFHRGFSQSGTVLDPWCIQEQPLEKAKRVAMAVGCPVDSTRQMVNCLKERPHHQLLDKIDLFYGYRFMPFAPFAPVVEKGNNPFLKDHPYHILKKKEVLDVPWIASHTSHEGLFPAASFQDDVDNINKKWLELAPSLLDFIDTLPKSLWTSVGEKIKAYYFDNTDITNETYHNLVRLLSDRTFLIGGEKAVKLQAEANKSPVYYQWFAYPGDNTDTKEVSHGADIKYYFGFSFPEPKPLTQDELKMKDIVWKLLVTYAKTGRPQVDGVEWKPTKSSPLTYLNVSGTQPEKIRLQTIDSLVPGQFWKELGFLENENLILVKDEL